MSGHSSAFIKATLLLLFILAPFAHSADNSHETPERLIIIDDDVGMNRKGCREKGTYIRPWFKVCDPDGGLELIYTLREPGAKLLGATVMMGCSTTDVCYDAARNILSKLGRDEVPVYKGAQGPEDLGKETPAARFIVDTVMANPGKVEIIATGPLTNIATALMLEPDLPRYWRKLHLGTGEFNRALGETTDLYLISLLGVPDMNVNTDAKATRYVLEHGGDFPIYPNEVMNDLSLTVKDYKELKRAGTPLSDFVARELEPVMWVGRTAGRLIGMDGMFLHGVIPAAMALDSKYAGESVESAVKMKKFGRKGYAFVLSDDPSLPKHIIHTSIENGDELKNSLMRRLQ